MLLPGLWPQKGLSQKWVAMMGWTAPEGQPPTRCPWHVVFVPRSSRVNRVNTGTNLHCLRPVELHGLFANTDCMVCRILVPRTGDEPVPLQTEVQSSTTGLPEVPENSLKWHEEGFLTPQEQLKQH